MSNDNPKIEVRDLRTGDWLWTHKTVLFSVHINPSVFKVYCGIASYTGNLDQRSWPSLQTLATKLNLSKSTVISAIKTLESCGIMKIDRGDGICNTYYLLPCEEIKPPKLTIQSSPFKQIIDHFHRAAQKYRGVIVQWGPKDMVHLKRVINLSILSQTEIEQLALYYLANERYKKFAPTMSVFLSSGILTGLVNNMRNDRMFWKDMESYMMTFSGVGTIKPISISKIDDLVRKLAEKMAAPAASLKI